jgi:hypothetical protein
MTQIHGTTYYSPADVAASVSVSAKTVWRFINMTDSPKEYRTWRRLDESEFNQTCATLRRCKELCPSQPLHAYRKLQRDAG